MNANELADNISLDNCHLDYADRLSIATMLRQQQARNKLLTDVLIETNTFVRELRAENEALKAEIERRKEINIIRSLHE